MHSKNWQKVGRELNALIEKEGNDAVGHSIFSYWGLIRDIIESSESGGGQKQLLSVAEFCLKESLLPSHSPSCASLPRSSFTLIDMPSDLSPPDPPSSSISDPTAAPLSQKVKAQLHSQISDAAEIVRLQKRLSLLTSHFSQVPGPAPSLAFPITHSQSHPDPSSPSSTPQDDTRDPHSSSDAPACDRSPSWAPSVHSERSSNRGQESLASSDSESSGGEDAPPTIFHRLKFKKLEKLYSAVRNYGPNAPFTLSLLEDLAEGGHLTPNEWIATAQSVLNRCRDTIRKNYQQGWRTAQKWSLDKLLGQGKYSTDEKQCAFSLGLLAHSSSAALAAWRSISSAGALLSPMTKILQGPQEPFSDFVARLLVAAERSLGPGQTDNKLLTQLAYKNANSACKANLRGKFKGKDLDEMIQMCREVDPITDKFTKAILAVGTTTGSQACFHCGQNGYFARNCPNPTARGIENSATSDPPSSPDRPPPNTVCPHCRRGCHWANTCHSRMDVMVNPLPPCQGNFYGGQSRAPRPIMFQPASGQIQQAPIQPPPPSLPPPLTPLPSSPPQTPHPRSQQDWTSVPPPQQY
ncbi:endogenous retrovirus group K member 6 Gag polyprotein-like [Mastomys coucha]|uniref:endogenous retrovirus group K member 6 Gag polyprotein-like n=1 Tax=Mastomys coucha TaxID=35658 RepID=UPI001262A0E6|nr:endogenous retrovirus group K member 6 Gag polyprotein-like [Mastomys coucha]